MTVNYYVDIELINSINKEFALDTISKELDKLIELGADYRRTLNISVQLDGKEKEIKE